MKRASKCDIKYRIVWLTEAKKPFLIGRTALRAREIMRQICRTLNVKILSGHVMKYGVELFVLCPPNISVSKLIQRLKGGSSRVLLREFPELCQSIYDQHLWMSGYFCMSVGNSSDKAVNEYINME